MEVREVLLDPFRVFGPRHLVDAWRSGGPVGAVIGAGVGSTVGMAAEPPDEVVTYVRRERAPSVRVEERVVVGEPLPSSVEIRTVPKYDKCSYAVVNDRRVIVEPRTRKVIKVID